MKVKFLIAIPMVMSLFIIHNVTNETQAYSGKHEEELKLFKMEEDFSVCKTKFSRHALERMKERHIKHSDVEKVLDTNKYKIANDLRRDYCGIINERRLHVITGSNSEVVTVYYENPYYKPAI